MRPIEKKNVGDVVNLFDNIDGMKTIPHIVQEDYPEYGKARKVLLANLGNYCSYCECYLANGALLQTEHVQPKGLDKYKTLKTKWENFLLACATCNGKGNKGEKDVVLPEIHLPHINNTYKSLCYQPAGVVIANPKLNNDAKQHAEALITLIGLDKPDSETDFRCNVRRQTWDRAQLYLKQYEAGEYELDKMIDDIKERNCWSIWFTVFKGHDEVRKALIDEFTGTAAQCFDANNHYEPIDRNPGHVDPT